MSTYPNPDASTDNPWARPKPISGHKPTIRELCTELVRLDRETWADIRPALPALYEVLGPVSGAHERHATGPYSR